VRQSINWVFSPQPEVTMHSPIEPAPVQLLKRRHAAVLVSIALHAAVFALALLLGTAAGTRVIVPGPRLALLVVETAGGSHPVQIQLPASPAAAHTRHPEPDADVTKKTILPIAPTPPQRSGGGAPPSPHAGNGSGQATVGNGTDAEDAEPAFPVFSPHPPVTDRSLLPAAEQKIVVDVSVDATGAVVSENLVKGMGSKLDQIVLEIVMTWRFQPATVNGKPVPSEAELIFPFNQSYPITES
jgi:TonB family protein